MGSTEVDAVTLLGRANPNGCLAGAVDDDVLIGDVLDEAESFEFHVNSFVGVVHVGVSKSHVLNDIVTDRPDGQSDSASSNSLKSDVVAGAFDAEGVVLVPDVTIVYPDVVARHVKAVSVESCHVNDAMVVLLSASVINRAEPDLHTFNVMSIERPVRRVVEVEVFNQSVVGVVDFD